MTTKEYAAIMGVTSRAVTKAINEGRLLEGILSFKKIGRDWHLEVDEKKLKQKKK